MSVAKLKRCLERRRTPLACVVLAAATVFVYAQVSCFEFTNYDDPNMLLGSPMVMGGLTLRGAWWALTTSWFEYWHPVTWLSHMLDFELFGANAGRHHLVSLGFHLANSVLLFTVLWRLTAAFWRSALVACLFAVHPAHVESVAWVAERKDLLSGFFFMLTLWAYAKYVAGGGWQVEERGQRTSNVQHPTSNVERVPASTLKPQPSVSFYLLSLLFFALGLMSKPMLVTVPFVLLLLDYWPLRRFTLNSQPSTRNALLPLLREKLPFFALSIVSCIITYAWALKSENTISANEVPWGLRLANVPVSYAAYLGKLLWPADLAVLYPMPSHWTGWQVGGATAVLAMVTLWALARARAAPYWLVGWLVFLGVLLPTIRLVQSGAQSIADRYTYIPSIGLFVALVWGGREGLKLLRAPPAVGWCAAGVAILICLGLTHRQVGYWRDAEALWRHAVAVTPSNEVALINLGGALADKGHFDQAIPCYEAAIRMNPGRAGAHSALADALTHQQRLAEALIEYQEAVRLNPKDAEAHNNAGSLLLKQGRTREAIQHYAEAVRLNGDDPEPRANLALALLTRGRYEEAAAQLREVIRLDPGNASAREKLDRVWAAQDRFERSVEPWRKALRANPQDARARGELGRVLLEAGQVDEAIEQLQLAGTNYVEGLDTLAAAFAEAGRLEEAAATAQQAEATAVAQGQAELAEQIRQRLAVYRARQLNPAPK
jgi:protein O-mannosyl-transferase